jgi:RNA polymerase sigma-70 factor (ECF subfamily)
MKMDEHELVEKLKKGDEMAFVEIVKIYKNRIVNFLYQLVGDYERAVDLSQETFLRVYFKAKKYKPIAPFSSWIYTIASNLAKTELKKMLKIQTVPLEEVINSPNHIFDSNIKNREKITQIKEAIHSLPPKYKIPIILKDLEGFTQEEIARILKLPVGTVKARISRGRNMLKNLLGKKGVIT